MWSFWVSEPGAEAAGYRAFMKTYPHSNPLRHASGALLAAGMVWAALTALQPAHAAPDDAPAAAQPVSEALPPSTQKALDAAVSDYQRGRLQRAHAAFSRLARAGVAAADYNLGVMNLRHELPHASARQAQVHLQRAATAGFVTAQYGLGALYEGGQLGEPDRVKALEWFRIAAEAGSVDAQVNVGTAYYLGRGIAADPVQALHWYRLAAQGGDVGAQYLLASMLETGLGTEADLRLAHYWYDVAARNGDIAAVAKRDELAKRLAASV